MGPSHKPRPPAFGSLGRWLILPLALAALALATASGEQTQTSQTPELLPVPHPNLAHTVPSVRRALAVARESFDALIATPGMPETDLAGAYGDMGLLYHAHLAFSPAEACYRNAALLAPADFRWPYYLAYLHQQNGRLAEAAEFYRVGLARRPGDPKAQLRLAQTYLELNRLDLAEPLFEASASVESLRGPALFGLGRLALARRDFRRAAHLLEQALQASPQASRIHYSLAMAYRGLEELDRARDHLGRRGDVEPGFQDPLIEALERRSTGQRTLYHHAVSAIRRGQYDLAVEAFREGLATDPGNVDARVSLARTLYLAGDHEAARQQLEEVLGRAPAHTLANFLLGALAGEMGSREAAIAHYRKTLAAEPGHAGAHFFLANALMGQGDYQAASRHYAMSLRQNSGNHLAGIGEILALVRVGAPHGQIRSRLEAGRARHPDEPTFSYFLALLLAASPDDGVRDGGRSLAIANDLYEGNPIPEHAEVLAMAYAELGQTDRAAGVQGDALSAAMASGRYDLLPRLEENLRAFQAGRPCRRPWREDGALMAPIPSNVPAVFKNYPTDSSY